MRAAPLLRALDRRELAAHRHRAVVGRALGVSDDALLVLLHLARSELATHAELSALVGLSRSGMGSLLQRLEQADLVARRADPADRRVRRIALTDAARERLADAYRDYAAGLDRLLAGFSDEEQATVARFLDGLAGLGEHAAPATCASAPQDRIWLAWG